MVRRPASVASLTRRAVFDKITLTSSRAASQVISKYFSEVHAPVLEIVPTEVQSRTLRLSLSCRRSARNASRSMRGRLASCFVGDRLGKPGLAT